MKDKSKVIVASIIGVALVLGLSIFSYYLFLRSVNDDEQVVHIYVDNDDTSDSVSAKLQTAVGRSTGYAILCAYNSSVRTGRYAITPGESWFTVYRHLKNGVQDPIMLTIPSVRTTQQLAGRLSHQLMLDSASIASCLSDSTYLSQFDYTPQTVPALFIPNTYQVYWDMDMDAFMQRMQRENDAFWNAERQALADSTGFNKVEIITLASIVDEETANNGEKPTVAGLYINRLKTGMKLQADPTVKFAIGDFSLRRIYNEHLTIDNPYNTYRNEGLPPGPIRIPSIAGIDAVLHYAHHNYIYMCAKEDFSGTHNFAVTYAEHLQNAAKYTRALNQRGIK